MVKVSIEVRHEAARFTVSVTAPSIRQAQTLVQAHYPASVVEVTFPIDPERVRTEFSETEGMGRGRSLPSVSALFLLKDEYYPPNGGYARSSLHV
jgi:hypothetical protein